MQSFSDKVTLSSSDTAATLPSSVTFVDGVATFSVTFNTAGIQTLTATDSANSKLTSPSDGSRGFLHHRNWIWYRDGHGNNWHWHRNRNRHGNRQYRNAATGTGTGTGTGSGTGTTGTGTGTTSSISTTTSSNWSGYAAETNLNSPQADSVTAVYGSWKVPTVTGSGTAYTAVWVGIDGYGSSSVEQIGTEQDVVNGHAEYSVWWEMYPAGSVTISSVDINPGDSITASVVYSTSTGKFTLSIEDTTNRESFSIAESGSNLQRSSAEWIVEAPSSGEGILQLADFGTVTFTGATATIDGVNGPISDSAWQAVGIDIAAGQGSVETSLSSLTSNGTSFTDTYVGESSSGGSSSFTFGPNGNSGSRTSEILTKFAVNKSPDTPTTTSNSEAAHDQLFASLDWLRG